MKNPYEILGIASSANESQIKDAYIRLMQQYDPSAYNGHPLAPLAEEKRKEIEEAYDEAIRIARGQQGYQNSDAPPTGNCDPQKILEESAFPEVRKLFCEGRFVEGAELLSGVPESRKNAEWYYLKAVWLQKRGFLEESFVHICKALEHEPNNPEYRQYFEDLNRLRSGGSYFAGYQQGHGDQAAALCCNMCTVLSCMRCMRCC